MSRFDDSLDEPPRKRPGWVFAAAVAGVAVLAVGVGLGIGQVGSPTGAPSTPASVEPTSSQAAGAACEDLAPPAGGGHIVLVFYPCESGELEPVSTNRSVEFATPTVEALELAIRAVLDGPTAFERDAGLAPVLSSGSSALLAGVELSDDGLAVVDFAPELQEVNNLATSAASGAFLRSLEATALQFDDVTALELRLAGSCDALFELLQATCQHIAKPIEPISDCLIIVPAELPSGAPPTEPRAYPGEPMVSWGSGEDTVTQLPGHRPAGGEVPEGTPVEVRGYPGFVVAAGDMPLPPPMQITWIEDGCRYDVFVRLSGGEAAAVDYARRFGPVVAGPPPAPPGPTVEAEGIRLTLAIDRDRTVHGERVFATATIQNIGTDSVFWGHSGTCEFPASVSTYPDDPERLRPGRTDWPGDEGILKSVTVDDRLSGADPSYGFLPENWLDSEGQFGCTTDLVISELAAGDVLVHRVGWDTIGYYDMPPMPGAYTVEAQFSFMTRGAPPVGDEQIDAFSVRVGLGLAVDGEDVGYVSPGEAFDALLEDPGYRAHLADAPRGLWIGSDIEFVDERWEAVLYLSESDAEIDPVRALVGIVDARTGEVLSTSFEDRSPPGGG